MTDRLIIALAQLNPTVGDVDANAALIRQARAEAAAQGADLVLASELLLSGYPPEDLVLKPDLIERVEGAVASLAEETGDGGPGLIFGTPWRAADAVAPLRGQVFNAAVLLDEGELKAVRFKHDLPNYGVFDEKRVFRAGELPGPVNFRGVRIGIPICRGYLDARCRRVPGGNRRRDPAGAQRQSLRGGKVRRAAAARGGPGDGDRLAAHLREPGRRPGRAGVRRQLLRARRVAEPAGPAAGLRKLRRDHALEPRRR